MRLCAYVRVSDTAGRDPETATSAPDQRRAIEGYAENRSIEIAEWLEEYDESGGKWGRPDFQRALAMVDAREVDGIIVARLDRFSRRLLDALRAIDMIDQAGGHFVSVAENFDTTTPMGRAMMQIALVFAELERGRIAENWATQKRDAIERGVQIGRAPLGYLRGPHGVLEKDPKAAPVVRQAFLRRATGATLRELADFMASELDRGFSHPMVGKMLRSRTYLGEVRASTGVNPMAHEAIVSRAEWEGAQARNRVGVPRERLGSLLAGLVRCAGCGYPLKRTSADQIPVYRCHGRHVQGRCSASVTIAMARLDSYVEGRVLERAREFTERVSVTRRSADLDAAIVELEQAEAGLIAYRDSDALLILGLTSYNEGLRSWQERVDNARRAVAEAQSASVVLPFDLDFETIWRDGDLNQRRTLLRGVVDAVFVRRGTSRGQVEERALILWNGEAPDDLPGRNGGRMRSFDFDNLADTARILRASHN